MEENIREIILRELPNLITQDAKIREWVRQLVQDYAPSRTETESRFEKMLAELRAMREESERKWAENQRKWEENDKRLDAMLANLERLREESERKWAENQRNWEENQRKWEENERRWKENERRWEENAKRLDAMLANLERLREESERKWEENQRKWEENERRWRENERRWEENQRHLEEHLRQIARVNNRIDTTIRALGARWGLSTEASFRNALKGILEESFGVKVERVEYKDETGEVYPRPDQVELDVIIRNGQMLICEIKASASRSDIYTLMRKVRSYEKRIGRQADRVLLISPMVNPKDQELARELGIEVYSDAQTVDL
ncbi:MAG: hypothetical protein ANABAC_3055 [Anaerolineae bacterium]|jgi:hypothetical protein|nr:MAG: hypothetical protein ANABAC_3055 [Anaerolineae bacterium]